MKPRTGITLGILILAGAGSLWAAGPRPKLNVSTHGGKAPLDLTIAGSITGIDRASMERCRVRMDRTYKTPSGIVENERHEFPCAEPAGKSEVLSFSQVVTLNDPGDYELRLIVTPASGREKATNTQEVKVYYPVEVRGSGTLRRGRE